MNTRTDQWKRRGVIFAGRLGFVCKWADTKEYLTPGDLQFYRALGYIHIQHFRETVRASQMSKTWDKKLGKTRKRRNAR
jgi:hypothetical protein